MKKRYSFPILGLCLAVSITVSVKFNLIENLNVSIDESKNHIPEPTRVHIEEEKDLLKIQNDLKKPVKKAYRVMGDFDHTYLLALIEDYIIIYEENNFFKKELVRKKIGLGEQFDLNYLEWASFKNKFFVSVLTTSYYSSGTELRFYLLNFDNVHESKKIKIFKFLHEDSYTKELTFNEDTSLTKSEIRLLRSRFKEMSNEARNLTYEGYDFESPEMIWWRSFKLKTKDNNLLKNNPMWFKISESSTFRRNRSRRDTITRELDKHHKVHILRDYRIYIEKSARKEFTYAFFSNDKYLRIIDYEVRNKELLIIVDGPSLILYKPKEDLITIKKNIKMRDHSLGLKIENGRIIQDVFDEKKVIFDRSQVRGLLEGS